ncbi:MAG: type II toxin-antitoxin system VapC family toxin [Rhodocyclaceae bacterium]|nr:type II toxin-antitoxin system VapC family toxin [Rhodocyclaceae bacterium]
MTYLLDTNICIHLMDAHPPLVVERFRQLRVGDVLMSVVTYAELRHGVERCPNDDRALAERALSRFVQRVPVLPFDERAAENYGVIAAAVRDRRRDALDRLIAAHAISVGAILVTNNEADFKDYPGLAVENWVKSAD